MPHHPLLTTLSTHSLQAEYLIFTESCHSEEAAAHARPEDFVKNICMIDAAGNLIVAIVKGEDRASTTRVGEALGIERPRTATPEEILERTGYPCGGTPSFGFEATFLIDPRVMEMAVVYTITPQELVRANGGRVVLVRVLPPPFGGTDDIFI